MFFYEIPCISVLFQSDRVPDLPLSQPSEDWFKEGPWTRMENDLSPQAGKVLKQYCVAAVLRKV